MTRRSAFCLVAFACLAAAIPALAAAAAPTLHYKSGGSLVPTGKSFTKTGSNLVFTSSTLGEIKCEKLTLEGTLTVNNTTSGIEGSGPSGGEKPSQTNCKNGTNAVVIENVTLTTLKSTTNGAATASFTTKVKIGAETICTFTGTNVAGTYVNHGNTLTFSSATGIKGSPAACGTVKLDGTFVLEEKGGAAVEAVFG